MIISKHKQGTPGWHKDKLGIPSASNFSKIITSTGAPSDSAKKYMDQLLTEWYLDKKTEQWEGNSDTKRGNLLEPAARKLYSLLTDKVVIQVGFCKMETLEVGCSPDSFVVDDGLLEIKSPRATTMVHYMVTKEFPSQYKAQVFGQLWITKKKWCDLMLYHPDFDPIFYRVEPDEIYIKLIALRVGLFVTKMLAERKRLFNNKKKDVVIDSV